MIYSGADLIRTSGQQQDRSDRLQIVKEVKPAEKPSAPKSSLDDETQSALLRFARFINKENEQKKHSPKKSQTKTGSEKHPYQQSMAVLNRHMDSGLTIDIYV